MAKINTVLELGTYKTRLLTNESNDIDGKIKLKSYYEVKSPNELLVSTKLELPIIDSDLISSYLYFLKRESKLGSQNIILLIPDSFVLYEIVSLSKKLTKEDKEKCIKDVFKDKMELPFDRWIISENLIESDEENEKLCLVALLKKNLLEIGEIVQEIGLNPIEIDTNFFNVANLIEKYLMDTDKKDKNIALINLGNESTTIGIFKNGIIKQIRSCSIGSYDFTSQISRHFHISEKDADRFKIKEPFFLPEYSEEQETFYNYHIIKDKFTKLYSDILKDFEDYTSKSEEEKIEEILLVGGGANFKNIEIMLKEKLKLPIKKVSELYNIEYKGKTLDGDERNSLAAAVGCFFREQ